MSADLTQDDIRAIEWEIGKLLVAFARFSDARDDEAMAGLFAEDGRFERRGEVLMGRAAILEAQRALPPLLTRHVLSNIDITVQGRDAATGLVTFTRYSRPPGPVVPSASLQPDIVGQHTDAYVRTTEGWRLRERLARGIFLRG